MDDDAQRGVRTVAADDVPFEAWWLHYAARRTWPVHLAVAWAAFPSRAETVSQAKRPTTFPREREARAEVIAALIAGRLVAYGVPDPGMPSDPAVEIPAERWRGLDLRDARTLCEPALDLGRRREVAFRSVEVETSGLFKLWEDPDAKPTPEDFGVSHEKSQIRDSDKEDATPQDHSTRQHAINELAAEMPAGFRWKVEGRDIGVGSVERYPFYRELERRFGGHVSRDDEAWPAWRDHYRFKPPKGRPRGSEQK